MAIEKAAALALLFVLLGQSAPTGPRTPLSGDLRSARELTEQIHASDKLLAQLFELQRRVRTGELVSDLELALDCPTREEILSGLDVTRAVELGFEPGSVRDRLQPGFLAELDLLAAQRARRDVGLQPEPSPLLTLVLDLEQDLWREADRRRQRAGIQSPLDSGPLSQRLQPEPATDPKSANAAAPRSSKTAVPPAPVLPAGIEPRLVGQAHYKAGRYADALVAWKDATPLEGGLGLELEYQRADCLMQTGQLDDAIAAWQKLASDNPGTSWAAQSEFALRVARTIKLVRETKQAQQPAPPIQAAQGGQGTQGGTP